MPQARSISSARSQRLRKLAYVKEAQSTFRRLGLFCCKHKNIRVQCGATNLKGQPMRIILLLIVIMIMASTQLVHAQGLNDPIFIPGVGNVRVGPSGVT
jgi:hypothetical protein